MTRGTGALVVNIVGTIMAYPLGWPSSTGRRRSKRGTGRRLEFALRVAEPHHVYPLGLSLVQDDERERGCGTGHPLVAQQGTHTLAAGSKNPIGADRHLNPCTPTPRATRSQRAGKKGHERHHDPRYGGTCRQHCGNHHGIPIGVAVQSQDDGGANVGRADRAAPRVPLGVVVSPGRRC